MKPQMIFRIVKTGLGPGGIVAAAVLLAIYGGRMMGLSGDRLWMYRMAVILLGGLAAGLVLWWSKEREKKKAGAQGGGGAPATDAVDDAFAAVDRRLKKEGGAGARMRHRPVVLVTGPTDSAKTTLLVRSGMEPELLAGGVWRGDEIAETPGVNIWMASDTLWVEAGGALLADEGRWGRLLGYLKPARLRAALARGGQPPRMALVCFNTGEFLKPGAAESIPAQAQWIRERLTRLSRELGIRLPVYVVFTKADRLPYFLDFVRNLTQDEAREVLGATLPLAPPVDSAEHADREGARVHHAFGRIFHALALRRSELLGREGSDEVRAGAYEFPRELRRVAPLATRFLVELSRPGQLGVSPFLRGFYFTGVRPVLVEQAAAPVESAPGASGPVGATQVFDVRGLRAAAREAAAPTGTRRIPQWTFLPRIFSRILVRDEVAKGVTAGGARVDFLRRAGLGAAALAFLMLAGGLVLSFNGNRGLVRGGIAAVQGVEDVGRSGDRILSQGELERLEALRVEASRIRDWQEGRRPARLGLGLYTGNRILPDLRLAYFHRFRRGMWAATRDDLGATLAALPLESSEAGDYGGTYDALKAYLITTRYPEYSTPDFLAPVLTDFWAANRSVEPDHALLASRQFEFFGRELAIAPPYDEAADDFRVQRAREYLGRFADANQFYQALLAGAAQEGAEAVDFHRIFPGSEAAVRSTVVVPAAFTREGWDYVQATLQDLDALLTREAWVLGDRLVAPGDRQRLAGELGERYVEDYVDAWTGFLQAATVLSFQGVPDAAQKLGRLSDNQSPLLQLLALASRNTAVDTTVVRRAFQPVHSVIPPDQTDRFISDGNQSYVQGLVSLYSAMDRATTLQGAARTQALEEASGAVDQGRLQVRQIAQVFNVDAAAGPVGEAVQRLMLAPLEDAERLARAGPAAEANAQAGGFCSDFNPLMAKYPFNVRGSTEATLDEVAAMFLPNASRLATFQSEVLQGVVVQQGTGYGAAPGAAVRPSDEFLRWFTRAMQVGRAFYAPTGSGPEVAFTLRPQPTEQLPEIAVTIDGQRQEVSRTSPASRTFLWDGVRAGDARIEATLAGNRVTLMATSGTWAVFRMFHQAEWQTLRPNLYLVTWRFQQPSATLTAEVSFDRAIPIFDPAFFQGLGCVSRVGG
jgi:type VI secretion system protein ImpL